ncbi:MAG: HAMP domain-containing histidine kinase [Oscillospiraceae bacterium]|nr:HAMP domain-containing histidine kinase [Oscillospiraceae bacterium]
MLKNSLFKRYFAICSICVISSVVVLGVVLLAFASQFLEREKYDMLARNARQAAAITADSYSGGSIVNPRIITLAYGVLASAIDAEIFLTKVNGETAFGVHMRGPVPESIMRRVIENGIYEETGLLGGVFTEPQYIVAVPVAADNVIVGAVFTAASASDMNEFMRSMLEMFFISAIVILIIAFILIYFITASLIKPLNEMLSATQSFSQGDFSVRVPIAGYDEIGKLAMAFNNMAGALATTENSRRSFVTNVSHELKTPMTTIGGFVDGILDGTVPEEKRIQYLKIVSAEVKRLSRLVRSMLDSARIEAGELKLNPVIFDLSEIVRQSVFTFEQVVTDKRVEIEGLEEDKIMVFADRDLIHQVVYNLVENAVKFVNDGGKLLFWYHSDGKMVYMALRNTGQGIERQEMPQLFERFYKSDKSRSLNKQGAGLGLHITRTILNYHKGEIFVRSVPGEYAEFECSIPAAPKN